MSPLVVFIIKKKISENKQKKTIEDFKQFDDRLCKFCDFTAEGVGNKTHFIFYIVPVTSLYPKQDIFVQNSEMFF